MYIKLIFSCLIIATSFFALGVQSVSAADLNDENCDRGCCIDFDNTSFITTANLNLRPTPCTNNPRLALVQRGTIIDVLDERDGEWFSVYFDGMFGYMSAEFLQVYIPGQAITNNAAPVSLDIGNNTSQASQSPVGNVEMISWSEARNILPKNTRFTVVDVRTGLRFQLISFSHGSHADVFPATTADTDIMRQAWGGSWSWDTRPVLVMVGDRTFAASMSGMPHAGGGNRGNGMTGHVCMHFYGSRTHNGNRAHEADHQASVREAYNSSSR